VKVRNLLIWLLLLSLRAWARTRFVLLPLDDRPCNLRLRWSLLPSTFWAAFCSLASATN